MAALVILLLPQIQRLHQLYKVLDKARAKRVNEAMLGMKKLDIAGLEAA